MQMACPWTESPNSSSLGDQRSVGSRHQGSEGDCAGTGLQPSVGFVPSFLSFLFRGLPLPAVLSRGLQAGQYGSGGRRLGGSRSPWTSGASPCELLPRSEDGEGLGQQAQTPALGGEHAAPPSCGFCEVDTVISPFYR